MPKQLSQLEVTRVLEELVITLVISSNYKQQQQKNMEAYEL